MGIRAKGEDVSISQIAKKRAFRLFAAGNTPESVVEEFEKLRRPGKRALMTHACAEKLYEEYLALPMGEKLRLTLMTENVANRLHRLMDDISDISLVDGLLTESDKKALALLLDIKRKIKERMSGEFISGGKPISNPKDGEENGRFRKFYDEMREGNDSDGKQSQ